MGKQSVPLPGPPPPDDAPPYASTSASTSTAEPPPADAPPSYTDLFDNPDEVHPPSTFFLHGRFLFPASNPTAPSHELSRAMHAQEQATTSIDFSRLEYRVRNTADGTPMVAPRAKALYKMLHEPILFTRDFESRLQCVSRQGLGNMTFKKAPFPRSEWRAARKPVEVGTGDLKGKRRDSGAGSDWYFAVKKAGTTYEWRDREGSLVATQAEVEGPGGSGGIEFRLEIVVPLTRRMREALLVLWCMWLWQLQVSGKQSLPGK
ncbi:hypothetical protein QBC39DRAFT_415576 [Podospora conica]|nr:hypothetical protein QBC39DRAFT_415576 [Schizothecium conicum]